MYFVVNGTDSISVVHIAAAAAAAAAVKNLLQRFGVSYNLDPFQERSDAEICAALEKCHMSQTVSDSTVDK